MLIRAIFLGAVLLSGCVKSTRDVTGHGVIELDEIDVASLQAGRVISIGVNEGDTVRAGDTLAVLRRDEIVADVQALEAEARRAAAQSREVRVGPRAEEIRRARAELGVVTAQRALAETELKRVQALFDVGAVAQAELDRARAAHQQAVAQHEAAHENLRILETGSRREEVTAAREAAQAASAQLEAARSRLGELVLVSPANGVVLLKNFDPGELALAGQPLVTLGNPDSLWMRVYVAAPLIGRVRLGARAEIRIDGDSHVYSGRVVQIATQAEFTPRAALTEEERANLVFAVKVVLDPTGGALKPGLPARVRILPAEAVRA